ncbi:MAG: HD domain-containing protein, partial [Planctomycetes bacterium]|nr:HD domain-containing protein [Planctomycetota bacterium]
SLRHLREEELPAEPVATQLIAKAKRVLSEALQLVTCLRNLADDPLLAGPPPEQGGIEADPLAIHFRDTASMMAPTVRLAQDMPDEPSIQSRLADGIEGIVSTVRQRLASLGHALDLRRRDTELVNRLAHLLVNLNGDQPIDESAFTQLAAELLAEGPSTPMRFLYTSPEAKQSHLGGPEYPAPARFIANHGITAARVMARMLRAAPEWSDRPLDPILAVLLKDVGMLRIPPETLADVEVLSDEQKRDIETHPRVGAELVANRLPGFSHLVEAIAAHHEFLDGTGYPSGLKDGQISSLARLLAVADTYTALCCKRPYRSAHDPRTALTDVLMHGESNILDRFAAEKLLAISLYPVGSVVEMSDGAIAVVAANHHDRQKLHLAARPVLNVLIDAQGCLLPAPRPIDLAESEGGSVVRTLPADERARMLGRHHPEWAI